MNPGHLTHTVTVERMAVADLVEVMAIERDSFSCPWSVESFRQEVADTKRSLPLLARIDGAVVGYGVAWFVADEIHIGNMAVHNAYRRRGIGEMLLERLLDSGVEKGCRLATLEVREGNRPAIALYEKFGFQAVAVRKRYYSNTGENAIVMITHLGPHVHTEGRRCATSVSCRRGENGVV